MITTLGRPLIGVICDLVGADKSYSAIFRRFLHAILLSLFAVMVSQQISLVYDVYGQKSEEYTRSNTLYIDEQCAFYKGSSQARIKECSELYIIIHSWPFVRAVSHVIKSWQSCVYCPCSDIVRNVADHLQYKIAFIVIALALFSYSYNLIGCTKKKTKEYVDKYKWKQTMAEMQALQQKPQGVRCDLQ